MKPDVLVLKIGGSLFSDKSRSDHLDHEAMAAYAALVRRIVDRYPGRLIMITGGGGYGHGAIRDHGAGGLTLTELTRALFVVKDAWSRHLGAAGVDAFPLQLAAMCVLEGDRPEIAPSALTSAVGAGAVPVLSGDCLFTRAGELTAFSSDRVPEALTGVFPGSLRVITFTDVPGILVGGPGGTTVLREVDAGAPEAAYRELWGKNPWDSTGAMHGKLDALTACGRAGSECFIMRGDPDLDPVDLLFAPVAEWPAHWQFTRIAAAGVD